MTRNTSFGCCVVIGLFVLLGGRAAAQQCNYPTDCTDVNDTCQRGWDKDTGAWYDNGHTTRAPSAWPYTEDIANGGNCDPGAYQDATHHQNCSSGSTPQGIVELTYDAALNWREIQAGCVYLNGNLRASAPFHAYLRALTSIVDCHEHHTTCQNVPAGTHWESQLVIVRTTGDANAVPAIGQEIVAAWDVRRMRDSANDHSLYRQHDRFANVVANLATGDYAYSQRVRMVDNQPGKIVFETQWITGKGVPSQYYPASGGAFAGRQTISSTWTAVGVPVPFHNDTEVELSLVGSGQLVSGPAGQTVDIALYVDGPPSETDWKRFGRQPIPSASQAPDGFTAIDTWYTPVAVLPTARNHIAQMYMRAPAGSSVVVENATLNLIGYPVSAPLACPREEIRPSTNLPDNQAVDETPITIGNGGEEGNVCGQFKKILQVDIRGNQQNVHDVLLNGYIEFIGNVTGNANRRAEIFIKAELLDANKNSLNPPIITDLGIMGLWAPTSTEGMWFSTDGIWSNAADYQRLTLFVRKVSSACGGGEGTFDIGKRWLTVKFLPSMAVCAGTPAEQCHFDLLTTDTTNGDVPFTPPPVPIGGGTYTLRVKASSERPQTMRNCWWRATSLDSFITADTTPHKNNCGNDTPPQQGCVFSYTVAANTGLGRSGTLNVGGSLGGTLTIKQPCASHCRAVKFRLSAPTSAMAGLPVSVTVSAIDENDQVITAYDGMVSFSSSDSAAVLPGNYTFTSADGGTHVFQATLYTANSQTIATAESGGTATGSSSVMVMVPSPPANVQATFNGTGAVTIGWAQVAGAAEYHIYRFTNINAPSTSPILIVPATQLTTTDWTVSTGPARPGSTGVCYLYAVKTYANGVESTFGQYDYAPTFTFTDPVLVRFQSLVRGVHIAELRYVIDTIRQSVALAPAWSNYNAPTGVIAAADQTATNGGLRPALDAARTRLGKSPWTYTYSPAAGTLIHLEDVTEVRTASQ